MISVLVCSVNPALLTNLKLNIEHTIGTEFELISYDNRSAKKGICSVYNSLAQQAKYDILCFTHEDVKIHSDNWGKALDSLLENEAIGLVGISGAVYKSAYPSTWSACSPELYRINAIQHFRNKPGTQLSIVNPDNSSYARVAVMDGVFMCTRKSVWAENNFNSDSLKGFHGYDMDYSLCIGLKYKVVVSFEILLEHFSEGNLTKDWLSDSLLVHRKWKNRLPLKVVPISNELKKKSDYRSCQSFLVNAMRLHTSKSLVLKYYLSLIFRFNSLNGLKHTKTTLKYLFS